MASNEQAIHHARKALESFRSLQPSVSATAADPDENVKLRWTAFDQIYDFVVQEMERQGVPLRELRFSKLGLTEKQIYDHTERSKRALVAYVLLAMVYGDPKTNIQTIMLRLEELVPVQPDPETWRPMFANKDSIILFDILNAARTLLEPDFDCFYQAHSEPIQNRRKAFKNIYDIAGPKWCESSDFAKMLSPEHRQRFVILGLMSFVPADQWNTEDLVHLRNDLLPVAEHGTNTSSKLE